MLADEEGELESLARRAPKGNRKTEVTKFEDLLELATRLSEQMRAAAEELQFEIAASLRDELNEIKREIKLLEAAGMANNNQSKKGEN